MDINKGINIILKKKISSFTDVKAVQKGIGYVKKKETKAMQ